MSPSNWLAVLCSVLAVALLLCLQIVAQTTLSGDEANKPGETKLYEMKSIVQYEISQQIGRELHASVTYLAMAAFFGQDSVSLLGFRKFFMDNSNEEKKHADQLVEYLNSRNGNLTTISIQPVTYTGKNGLEALRDALALEEKVTNHLMAIHQLASSDKVKDVHLVDYLESDLLREQVESIRHLKGRIAKLSKMSATQTAALAEYLYDLELGGKLD